MKSRVTFSRRAKEDIQAAYDWWAQNRSVEQAERWYDGILEAVESLRTEGAKFREAVENPQLPIRLQVLPFGLGRRPTHRVLFANRPEGVYIVRVRHVSQDAVGPDDL